MLPTLGNDSCNLSRNGVSPFARHLTRMVLLCAMILATCFTTVIEEVPRESVARYIKVTSTNQCETSLTNHCEGCYTRQFLQKSLQRCRNRCDVLLFTTIAATKKCDDVRCGVCYSRQLFMQLVSQQNCEAGCTNVA